MRTLTPKTALSQAVLRLADFPRVRTAIVIRSGPESPHLTLKYRNQQYDGNQADEYACERVTHEDTERSVRKYQ